MSARPLFGGGTRALVEALSDQQLADLHSVVASVLRARKAAKGRAVAPVGDLEQQLAGSIELAQEGWKP